MRNLLSIPLFLWAFALPASADVIHSEDTIIRGNLCIGCSNDGDAFGNDDLIIRDFGPVILFDDTGASDTDWLLNGDQDNGVGASSFAIENPASDSIPFSIDPHAPTGTLALSGSGRVGLGTLLPQRDLHVVGFGNPTIRMDKTGFQPQIWDLVGSTASFYLQDTTAGRIPFRVLNGAPAGALTVGSDGDIGLGTTSPSAPLELSSSDSFNFFRITAAGAAVNDSVDITFTGGPLGTGQLRYNIVDGDNQEMSLDANGNVVIDGTLTTAGPTCAGGCDRVFDADYPLPSIVDHATQMFGAGYLPSIGATVPNAPVNLSERQGNIINALEHAHIYIAQQDAEISQHATRIAEMEADYTSQIEALSTRLQALERAQP